MIYIMAPLLTLAERTARELQLIEKPQFRRQDHSTNGMNARPGDLFIWVTAHGFRQSWDQQCMANEVRSMLLAMGVPLLEYTI